MSTATISAIGSLVSAVSAVGQLALGIGEGKPDIPELPKSPLPPPPRALPPAAPTKEDNSNVTKAVQRIREQSRRRTGASTILTSPLGISTTDATNKTSVLGR